MLPLRWRPSHSTPGSTACAVGAWIDGDPVPVTSRGRAVWEWIEAWRPSTNAQLQPVLDAIGDDYDELLGYLEPWAAAIVGGGLLPERHSSAPTAMGSAPQ